MTIGEKIEKIRKYRGFKQEFVADKLQITQAGYSRIERGEVDIPFSRLEQLAKIFEISLNELVSFDEKSVFTSYINNSQLFTTNGSIISDKELLIKLEKQYETRVNDLQKQIERLHDLLKQVLSK
jgi:transcriptional regulator with XRE-family HTH domain